MMDLYLGVVTTMHWSDEHESITVRSDELAAFPVDVGGMSGSVKKEPSSLQMTVSLGVSWAEISNSINRKKTLINPNN